jgi:AraC family transcriptional regulator
MHVHNKPLFCMVLDGAYYETHGGKTRYCTPATVLFHASNEDHLEQFEACGGRSLVIEIEPEWLSRVQEYAGSAIHSTAAFEEGPLSLLGARLYKEFLTSDQASGLVIEGLMMEVAGEIARARRNDDQHPPRWLDRSRELIRDRFAAHFSLSGIAEAVGVHPVHLAQAFRKYYHCTIGDYVRTLRIGYACRQLRFSDLPLCEIAQRAGFADQSHFTRTFKQMVGVPPSQYRQTVSQL